MRMGAGNTEIRDRITALVEEILAGNSVNAKVPPHASLADAGLTSMDMVNLMLGVEAAFDMTLPQSDITPENFQSIETIERLVSRHRHIQAA